MAGLTAVLATTLRQKRGQGQQRDQDETRGDRRKRTEVMGLMLPSASGFICFLRLRRRLWFFLSFSISSCRLAEREKRERPVCVQSARQERESLDSLLLHPLVLLLVAGRSDALGRRLALLERLAMAHVGVDDVDVADDLGLPLALDL